MKQTKLLFISLITMGGFLYAGGGEAVAVSPYENEKVIVAEEAYVEPVVEPAPEPVAIAPLPIKDINPSGFYAGLGIAAAQYRTNCDTGCSEAGKDKTAGLMGRIGYDFNKYVGIEVRGMRTNWKSNGGKIKHAGVYVKPMLPVGDATNIYGLVGVAKTTTQGRLQRTDAEALALGLGVEYDLSKDTPKEGRYGRPFDGKGNQEKGLGLFIDYERMVVKEGAPDLDAVSTGVTYDF